MGFTNESDLRHLYKKLKQFSRFKKENRLDFMEWSRYARQNEARLKILNRVNNKEGENTFVIFGSNRSGKTELGAGVVAEIFKSNKNCRIWAATNSDLSVKAQQRKLHSIIRKCDIDYGEFNLVRGWKNKTIISKSGTVIYLKTYEQGAASFQGDDIDLAWFDEEPPWDVFSETMIRLSDRRGIMLMTFTTLLGFTRVVNKVWQSPDPKIYCTTLLARENPFLSNESKEQLLGSIDPDELKSRWDGEPNIKSGLIYKEYGSDNKIKRFNFKELVKNQPKRFSIHECIDPHERTPHHWLRFLYDRQDDVLYVVDELKAPRESMLISDFSLLIKAKRGGVLPKYCQIDTASMKPVVVNVPQGDYQDETHNIRSEFQRCGIDTILCVKDNAIGIESVKSRLKTVRNRSGEVVRKPKLFVFDDLDGLHFEFMRYSWESYSSATIAEKKEIINTPLKKNDHFLDCLKYECIKLKSDYEEVEQAEYVPTYDDIGY